MILQKNIKLKLFKLLNQKLNDDNLNNYNIKKAYDGDGILINSEFLNNLNIVQAKEKIINEIEKKNR